MPAQTSFDQAPVVRVIGSSSNAETSIRVEPPIEDMAAYELCMRAIHGDALDPRQVNRASFDSANAKVEGATVLEAPQAERIWEMWPMRERVHSLFEGMGYVVDDGRNVT